MLRTKNIMTPLEIHPITSEQSSYPETLIKLVLFAYNKQMNKTTILIGMYDGGNNRRQQWSAEVLTKNKRHWYTLDSSWEITHWAELLIPDVIEKINNAKKITEL